MTDEQIIEARILAALRAMSVDKSMDMVGVMESVARHFPRQQAPAAEQPRAGSLRLVVSESDQLRIRQTSGHNEQRSLAVVSL